MRKNTARKSEPASPKDFIDVWTWALREAERDIELGASPKKARERAAFIIRTVALSIGMPERATE